MKCLQKLSSLLLMGILVLLLFQIPMISAQEKKQGMSLDKSQEITEMYLESFKKTGIPTPNAVDAAIKKARSTRNLKDWSQVVEIANSYANIVDVLRGHYSRIFRNTKQLAHIDKAASYETARNHYMKKRDEAYTELAKLYLEKGDKVSALSYAITALEHNSLKPDVEGEKLIKQIIEYSD